jgi:hypothetical protein
MSAIPDFSDFVGKGIKEGYLKICLYLAADYFV